MSIANLKHDLYIDSVNQLDIYIKFSLYYVKMYVSFAMSQALAYNRWLLKQTQISLPSYRTLSVNTVSIKNQIILYISIIS